MTSYIYLPHLINQVQEFLYLFSGTLYNHYKLNKLAVPMRGNHLPVSATRWQHWYQICFATLIWWKISKLLITQQPLKQEKKISTYLEPLIFLMYCGKEWVWPDSLWKTLFIVLHHITDPLSSLLLGFYTHQHYSITS